MFREIGLIWRIPVYSSIYLRESHVQGNRFDLENPGLKVGGVQSTMQGLDLPV